MASAIELAVRDMRMTVEEAVQAATLDGRAPCSEPTSATSPRAPAPTFVVLDAPAVAHLIYRPGVPLVAPRSSRGAHEAALRGRPRGVRRRDN